MRSGEPYTYALVKTGPEVLPAEVESPSALSIEVIIVWGANVLHVAHLAPSRSFTLGENYPFPEQILGSSRQPVVIGGSNSADLVIPPAATGYIEMPDRERVTLDSMRAKTDRVVLHRGLRARLALGDFVLFVSVGNAGKRLRRGFGFGFGSDWGAAVGLMTAWAAYAIALVIAVGFLFRQPFAFSDDDQQDRLAVMRQLHARAGDRERQEVEQSPGGEGSEGGSGRPDVGAEAAMGKPTAKPTGKRYAVYGPRDNPDPHIARETDLRGAREFGMIGLLAAPGNNAPSAPWGRDTSLGNDETSARGTIWGDEIGENFGAGGLGLTGLEQGGGGRGEGVGLGSIGTLGHGAGTGCVHCPRFGHGHTTAAPKLRIPAPLVNGHLPPDAIRRIVRQNHGRFRQCYEAGLTRNPRLEGTVTARFVIARDGSVSTASNGGSSLPDSGVVSCVIASYYSLAFPVPVGGIVTVTYPISFWPS